MFTDKAMLALPVYSILVDPFAINETAFHPFLKEFSHFEAIKSLERSPLYRKVQPEIQRVLGHVWQGEFAQAVEPRGPEDPICAVAWNIERGIRGDAIARLLRHHPLPKAAGVLRLSELDLGMARTQNRVIALEM